MKSINRSAVAADYMQRDLVTISPGESLRDALTLMTQNHITGLPVMDSQCRCIGLITSADILNHEQENSTEIAESRTVDIFDPDSQQWETISLSTFGLEGFGDVRVSEVMTRDLIWVDRETSLGDVARRMIDEHIHRILVMDKSSRLYGIISATDFVRFAAET